VIVVSHDAPNHIERPPAISDGASAEDVGRFLTYLSQNPTTKVVGDGTSWDSGWHSGDGAGLMDWAELEMQIHLTDFHRDSEDRIEPVNRFKELCHEFHTALPYDEAERTWLLQCMKEADAELELLSQFEGQIVSAGLRKAVHGRDLIRRWVAWHRETDEYAGQNTLGVARSALAGLIGLLAPKQPLPDAYLTLMRERDAAP
jgi:hypothetical protein